MISKERSPNKFKMKLKAPASIGISKPNDETSRAGIEEIEHLKPK